MLPRGIRRIAMRSALWLMVCLEEMPLLHASVDSHHYALAVGIVTTIDRISQLRNRDVSR